MIIDIFTITKKKSNIKGFWADNQGKIYIDNIKIIRTCPARFYKIRKALFDKGEKAVFSIIELGEKAFVDYSSGKREELKHKIQWQEKTLKPLYIKELIKQNGGLTIYKNQGGYILELWRA